MQKIIIHFYFYILIKKNIYFFIKISISKIVKDILFYCMMNVLVIKRVS